MKKTKKEKMNSDYQLLSLNKQLKMYIYFTSYIQTLLSIEETLKKVNKTLNGVKETNAKIKDLSTENLFRL